MNLMKNKLSIIMGSLFKAKYIDHYLSNGKDIQKRICEVYFSEKIFFNLHNEIYEIRLCILLDKAV